MRRAAVALVAVLVLAGCDGGGDVGLPGPAKVDVDTPVLRQMKADAGVEDCEPARGDHVDGGLPKVTLPCFGGGPEVDLGALRGPTVVNLWASWCGPCRREMPLLQQFNAEYGDRVEVLGIDWQDPQVEPAMELVVDSGVTYPLLADPDSELATVDGMPVRGLPGLVLLDEEGRVAYRNLMEIESVDQLVDLVNRHLGTRL
jgi:thiol-disulfide isomerase/thioredoxin